MPGPTPCTRCGAPLPESDGPRVCVLCGQYHDAGSAAGAGPRPRFGSGAAPGPGAPPPRPGGPRPRQAQTSPRAGEARTSRAVGCLVVVAVVAPVVVVLGVVGLAIWGSERVDDGIDGVVGTDLAPSTGDLLVLPGALDEDPQVVTMATPIGEDGRVIALVDLEDGPVWEAEVVPADVYSAQMVATDDVVLVSLGRGVVALDRATGAVEWEAEASDEVYAGCPACFVLVDGTLVVLGADGEVTALDPGSGEVLWTHRFVSPNGQVVPLGDRLLLVDDGPEDVADAALTMVLVRPSDGSEVARTTPTCLDELSPGLSHPVWASPDLPVIPVPGTDDVVIAYGTFPSCVQRWTITTGELRWSRITEARLDWYDAAERPWAVGRTDLVLAGYEEWLVVGLAEGGIEVVPAPADSLVAPQVVVVGDLFVGAASSTRGTEEWALVAHDLDGEERWTRDLGPDHTPAVVGPQSSTEYVSDGTLFALLPQGEGLRLLTIGPPGPRFAVSEVDPATGEGDVVGVAPVRTDLPTSVSARIDTVRDGHAVVDVDGVLHVIDLGTGAVGAAWGR